MIISELEKELRILESQRTDKESLDSRRKELQETRDDIIMLENQISFLRNRKLDAYDVLSFEDLKDIDTEVKDLHELVIQKDYRATECLNEIKRLEEEMSEGYNPNWGCLFKSSRRKSRFGDQVEDFACVYSSRVTNFSRYPITKYFRISTDLMAHERS